MTKSKLHCKMGNFVRQSDSNLYQALDDTCALYLLNPQKPPRGTNRDDKKRGVALIWPDPVVRKKIETMLYSSEPDVGLKTFKAYVINGNCENLSDLYDAVNLLNQKYNIKAGKSDDELFIDGLRVTKNNNFKTMPGRENMTVFNIEGPKFISTDNPIVEMNNRVNEVMGGGGCSSDLFSFGGTNGSIIKKMRKFLKHEYSQGRFRYSFSHNNIYLKKVKIHMGAILENVKRMLLSQNDNSSNQELIAYQLDQPVPKIMVDHLKNTNFEFYLGNDEFTDSYLLDMYCIKTGCTNCVEQAYRCLTNNDPSVINKIAMINSQQYINRKKMICVPLLGEAANNKIDRSAVNLGIIHNPYDFREQVKRIYNKKDEKYLLRDLYLAFTGIAKHSWSFDPAKYDIFECFSETLYTIKDLARIKGSKLDIAQEISLWGTLLRTDILLYEPQADFSNVQPEYNDMKFYDALVFKKFSLCGIQHKKRNNPPVVGGYFEGDNDQNEIEQLEYLL